MNILHHQTVSVRMQHFQCQKVSKYHYHHHHHHKRRDYRDV